MSEPPSPEPPAPSASAPAPDDRYRDRQDAGKAEVFMYSLGGIIDEVTTSGFRNLNTLLVIAFQMNPLIVGLIGALKTIWDGIMDPIIAHLSDNSRSRFGRRRPFILAGGILMALFAWVTWEFMPENPKLKPNDPVVPEVYFSDRKWKSFGHLALAYGMPDIDVDVRVEGDAGGRLDPALVRAFALESIRRLGTDTKALIRAREDTVGESATGAASIPPFTIVLRPLEASAVVAPGAAIPGEGEFSVSFEVVLRGVDLAAPLRTHVTATTAPETLTSLQREIPFVNRMVHVFTGRPKECGLFLRNGEGEVKLDIEAHRKDERAVLAAVRYGIVDVLSHAFGLPYWRIVEEGTVDAVTRDRLREIAGERFAREPRWIEALMVSAGAKLDPSDGAVTESERKEMDRYHRLTGSKDDRGLFFGLWDTIVIEEGASFHALARDPLQTRQFKGIWEKIADGFTEVVKAAPDERHFIAFVAVMFLAMAAASTVYNAPYYAMGIEIAPSYHGRTLVVAYRQVANSLISIFTQLFLPISLLPLFFSAREGSLWLVYVLAPVGIVLALIVFFGTRERTVVVRSKKKGPGFFRAIRQIGANPEFWRIAGLYIFMGYALGSFNGLGNLIAIYYLFDGNMVLGASYGSIAGTLGTVLAMLTIPVFVVLCKRLGKHNTLRLALGALATASILKYFCYNPAIPELMFIPPFFYSPAIAGFYQVLSTMMGDVTDLDELRHGERREGMFGAVMGIIMKSLGSFTAVAQGIVIVGSGFEVEKGAHQDPGVFHNMLVLFSIVPGVCAIAGFVLLYRFKLTRERVEEIKVQLAAQRRLRAEAESV